jgi:hypothetical protein
MLRFLRGADQTSRGTKAAQTGRDIGFFQIPSEIPCFPVLAWNKWP